MALIYDIEVNGIDGRKINIDAFKGKYILIVNVASECGYTAQYAQLQELYESFKDNIEIIGCPSNEFGGQEPGTNEQIKNFCNVRYGVSFTLAAKLKVKPPNQHPLYEWLTTKAHNEYKDSEVTWNFQKYLINPTGQLIGVFEPGVTPFDDTLLSAMNIKL